MNRELTLLNILLCTGFTDELLGQYCRFQGCQHPAYNVATEDVHDHIQIKICPFYRAKELGNVPGPDLIWPCSQKLRLLIYRVTQLVPAFLNLLVVVEDAIHGPELSFVQKGCVDFLGGLVHEPLSMKDIEHFLPFLRRQRTRRTWPFFELKENRVFLHLRAVESGTGDLKRLTGRLDTNLRGKYCRSFSFSASRGSRTDSFLPRFLGVSPDNMPSFLW